MKPKRQVAFEMAMLMYTNEPCRICGELITVDDLKDLVFAGYSKNNEARAAHLVCWQKYPGEQDKPRPEWVHQ